MPSLRAQQLSFPGAPADPGDDATTDRAKLRRELTELCETVDDLNKFLMDFFYPVYAQIPSGMNRTQRENELLSRVDPSEIKSAIASFKIEPRKKAAIRIQSEFAEFIKQAILDKNLTTEIEEAVKAELKLTINIDIRIKKGSVIILVRGPEKRLRALVESFRKGDFRNLDKYKVLNCELWPDRPGEGLSLRILVWLWWGTRILLVAMLLLAFTMGLRVLPLGLPSRATNPPRLEPSRVIGAEHAALVDLSNVDRAAPPQLTRQSLEPPRTSLSTPLPKVSKRTKLTPKPAAIKSVQPEVEQPLLPPQPAPKETAKKESPEMVVQVDEATKTKDHSCLLVTKEGKRKLLSAYPISGHCDKTDPKVLRCDLFYPGFLIKKTTLTNWDHEHITVKPSEAHILCGYIGRMYLDNYSDLFVKSSLPSEIASERDWCVERQNVYWSKHPKAPHVDKVIFVVQNGQHYPLRCINK